MKRLTRTNRRGARHARVRAKITGSGARPRLSVYRSGKHVYAQVIDDAQGATLAAASDQEIRDKKVSKTERAKIVGALIGERCKNMGISAVVFDRGGFAYHGRIRTVAEAARKAGLAF